ncbi:MAG: PilZ domain-containing protein [Pseudomonadota bacterium]
MEQKPKIINVILVSRSGDSKDAYINDLNRLGLQIDHVEIPSEILERCRIKKYSGIFVDLITLIKIGSREKRILDDISRHFPVMYIRVDPSDNSVVGLFPGQSVPGKDALPNFIQATCKTFNASKIRVDKRVNKILNVIYFPERNSSTDNTIRVNTVNITARGCFITPITHLNRHDICLIQIKELSDTSLIECTVKWIQQWGTENKFPGMGVAFEKIAINQHKQIREYITPSDTPGIAKE